MPHHKSAKKRLRQTERRTRVNRSRVSRLRTLVRGVEEAIQSGEKDAAANALRTAESQLQREVRNGLLHKNAAARKVSRLAHRINAL